MSSIVVNLLGFITIYPLELYIPLAFKVVSKIIGVLLNKGIISVALLKKYESTLLLLPTVPIILENISLYLSSKFKEVSDKPNSSANSLVTVLISSGNTSSDLSLLGVINSLILASIAAILLVSTSSVKPKVSTSNGFNSAKDSIILISLSTFVVEAVKPLIGIIY